MLCYVMLCYVMLCYVMLCYVMQLRPDLLAASNRNSHGGSPRQELRPRLQICRVEQGEMDYTPHLPAADEPAAWGGAGGLVPFVSSSSRAGIIPCAGSRPCCPGTLACIIISLRLH
jgi:hypothetical protein